MELRSTYEITGIVNKRAAVAHVALFHVLRKGDPMNMNLGELTHKRLQLMIELARVEGDIKRLRDEENKVVPFKRK